MPNKPKASIRRNRPGKWRGYIGDVRVIEFEDNAIESAEDAAKRWLANPTRPQKDKTPAAPVPAAAVPARQLIEHVKINYADVVQHGLAQNQNFLALYWEMQESFADREFGRRVCLHEATHAHFMEKSGIKGITFYGPAILFDTANNRFKPLGAMVRGDDTPDKIVDEAWVREVTKHAVAGGRALLKYENVSETGDEKDFDDFKLRCAGLPPSLRHLDPDELWKRASKDVDQVLSDPAVEAQIRAKADEYFRALYPSG